MPYSFVSPSTRGGMGWLNIPRSVSPDRMVPIRNLGSSGRGVYCSVGCAPTRIGRSIGRHTGLGRQGSFLASPQRCCTTKSQDAHANLSVAAPVPSPPLNQHTLTSNTKLITSTLKLINITITTPQRRVPNLHYLDTVIDAYLIAGLIKHHTRH